MLKDDGQDSLPDMDILNELYSMLDHLQPTIPDRVSTLLLESAGVRLDAGEGDVRLARLVSLAGQKFLSDVLSDAMNHWRLSNAQPTGLLTKQCEPGTQTATSQTSNGNARAGETCSPCTAETLPMSTTTAPKTSCIRPPAAEKRVTLTVDDLLAALRDQGIQVARPPYYK